MAARETLAAMLAFTGMSLDNGKSGPSEYPYVQENGDWVQKKVTPVWIWVKGRQQKRYRADDGKLYKLGEIRFGWGKYELERQH